MTDWITCGLPYSNQEFVDDDKLPPPPDVSGQEMAEFGVSVRDIENRHGEDKFIALDNLLLKVDWFKLTKAKIRKEEVRLATLSCWPWRNSCHLDLMGIPIGKRSCKAAISKPN